MILDQLFALLRSKSPRARIQAIRRHAALQTQADELEQWLIDLDFKAHPAFISAVQTVEYQALALDAAPAVEAQRRRRDANRKNAKRPRAKRGPKPETALIKRAITAVRDTVPGITAGKLVEMLDADGHFTDDEANVEIRLRGDQVVFRDLKTGLVAIVAAGSLRTYFQRNS